MIAGGLSTLVALYRMSSINLFPGCNVNETIPEGTLVERSVESSKNISKDHEEGGDADAGEIIDLSTLALPRPLVLNFGSCT